eukprot:12608628-Alexandrium_andersonii.AAC.1
MGLSVRAKALIHARPPHSPTASLFTPLASHRASVRMRSNSNGSNAAATLQLTKLVLARFPAGRGGGCRGQGDQHT